VIASLPGRRVKGTYLQLPADHFRTGIFRVRSLPPPLQRLDLDATPPANRAAPSSVIVRGYHFTVSTSAIRTTRSSWPTWHDKVADALPSQMIRSRTSPLKALRYEMYGSSAIGSQSSQPFPSLICTVPMSQSQWPARAPHPLRWIISICQPTGLAIGLHLCIMNISR
jgi:hypothetical protein